VFLLAGRKKNDVSKPPNPPRRIAASRGLIAYLIHSKGLLSSSAKCEELGKLAIHVDIFSDIARSSFVSNSTIFAENAIMVVVAFFRNSFVIFGIAATITINSLASDPSTKDLTPVQKEILRLSAETNKRLPMQIDSETVLVTTLPQSDNSFVYKYKLINTKVGEVTQQSLTSNLKPQAVAGYKTSMQDIRALGIRLVYHYSDKDGNFIGSFTVGPED
jgi:hypothetical protein